VIVLDDASLNTTFVPPCYATKGYPGLQPGGLNNPANFEEILQVGHIESFRRNETLKIAFFDYDGREHFHDYPIRFPIFGTAPQASSGGSKIFQKIEVHVISCVQSPVQSPALIGRNIFIIPCSCRSWAG